MMKRLIIFLLLFAAIKVAGQTTGYLRFDTVRIMKQNGTCELYLINSTKDSLGILTNVGGGLTRFLKSRAINDSVLVVGRDTLTIRGSDPDTETYYGVIYNQTTWANLSDFTQNGITASISSGSISVTGGTSATDFDKTLDLNYHTLAGYWRNSARINVVDRTATSYGFALGTNGSSSWAGHDHDVVAKLDLTNTGTSGQLTIQVNNGTTHNVVATSSTNLSFSAGENIILTIERKRDSVIASAVNLTTPGLVSVRYRFSTTTSTNPLPNTGTFSVYSVGGTQLIDSLSVTSREIKNATVMIIGDSKSSYFAATYSLLYGSLIDRRIWSTIISAGPGDRTTDVINRLPEIKALAPKQVLIQTFSNDLRSGMSEAASLANIDQIVDSLEAWGIQYYFIPFYETSQDLSPWNNHFLINYPTHYINTWDILQVSGYLTDGVHFNQAAHDTLSKIVINSYKLRGGTNRQDISGSLQAVTDIGNTTTNSITAAGITSTSTLAVTGASTLTGGYSSGANSSIAGVLTITSPSGDPITATTNSTGIGEYRITNTNSGGGAAAGMLAFNDAGFATLLYQGSSGNGFVPNGTLLGANGPGGLHLGLISPAANITFGGSFGHLVDEWGRFYANSGFFGLNKTVPLQRLHVGGKVHIDSLDTGSSSDSVVVVNNGLLKKVLQSSISGGGGGGSAGSAYGIDSTVIGGTGGSVLFVGTGPVLSQDNSNFFWDNSNKRLGIGTASPSSRIHISTSSLGLTQALSSGFFAENPTAAAAGAQQISPHFTWQGNGWKTNATAASQSVAFRADVLPVQGAAAPTGTWRLMNSINGGAYSSALSVSSIGEVTAHGGIFLSSQPTIDFGLNSATTNKLRLTTASLFGTTDLFFQGTSGAAGYTIFENTTGVGVAISTQGAVPIVFAPNRTIKARFNSAGELQINNASDLGAFTLQNTGGLYQNGTVQLNGIPGGTNSMSILVHHTDSNVYQLPASYFDKPYTTTHHYFRITNDATPGNMSPLSNSVAINIPDGSVGLIKVHLVANGGSGLATHKIQGVRYYTFNKNGGTLTIDAADIIIADKEGGSVTSASWQLISSSNQPVLEVTGVAATNINWTAAIEILLSL